MTARRGRGVLPHSALEFIVRGLLAEDSILSASSICLTSGEEKEDRIDILKSGAEVGC